MPGSDAEAALHLLNMIWPEPGLTIGTVDAAEVKIANACTVLVHNKPVLVAAQEVGFTATSDDIADPDTDPREAIFLVTVDAGGVVSLTRGADAAEDAAVATSPTSGEAVLGQVFIQHNGTAVFNATTDDLDAAHLTVVYSDAKDLYEAARGNAGIVTL